MLRAVTAGLIRAMRVSKTPGPGLGPGLGPGCGPGPGLGLGPGPGRTVIRQRSSRSGRSTSCIVDPNLQEPLVVLDLTDLEEEPSLSSAPPPPLQAPPPPLQAPPPHIQAPPPPLQAPPPPLQLRALERQLQVLRGVAQQEAEPDSLIQFQDAAFPLDEDLVASSKKKKKKKAAAGRGEHRVVGTPDKDEPVSATGCPGCGALLHCVAPAVPGYLPSEKFKQLRGAGLLGGGATCQRCHLLTHHRTALSVELSPEEYRGVVRRLRPLKALVLLVVDLLDVPDAIVPDLPDLVGANKQVVVLGNKVDLLPGDAPNYLQRLRRQLAAFCRDAGFGEQVTGVHLISAKTGYGVEALISSLQRSWRYHGDVYLVGGANAGKSTLFNTLLESDYCKSNATDAIHRATISPWPGTTLNLLKFPIINPTPHRLFRRQQRLDEDERQTEDELSPEELQRLRHFSQQGYLVGRVGRTFRPGFRSRPNEIQFDPDSLAFGEKDEEETKTGDPSAAGGPAGLSHNETKDAHWLFDTPGIMKDRDILRLLTEQEVMSVVPTKALVPRTFVLRPGTSLLLGALGRIDFLQGAMSCWFSVLASSLVPVHITGLDKVDAVYEKHAGHVLLGVPLGGLERMKDFPPLVPQDVLLEGRGYLEAAGDITMSSAGWVAVTAAAGVQVSLRVHGPAAAGFGVRTPSLLPHVVSLKGERVRKSPAYRPLRTEGRLDGGLSPTGTQRLNVEKKKKKKKKM
ncbi:nitric oxide-associated protein 1-like [Centropristis striata]|uniref:nitric oxide-associated protein 1-like n=1 Tax=Centropristis striata TaxID=184440 RepID=UPI0027E08669|nr:nitric oxide-associated protein 1-like [Centropristis striata]